MFVDTSRVAVTEGGEIDHASITPDMDVMYIRRKMDFGTRQKVISAAVAIAGGSGMEIDVGAFQLALAQYNILDWSGPSFAGVVCTPKAIARLDPDAPLLQAVLASIGERNPAGEMFGGGSDPKSTTAGAQNGAAEPSEPVSMILPFSARTTSDGLTPR